MAKTKSIPKKLYKVTLGIVTKDDDCPNWRSVNTIAVNAWDAINKVKAGRNEYTAEVEIIADVDVE